jgi:hypothetical protein
VTLADLAAMLREKRARKVDIVAPASAIRAVGGQLLIDGTDPAHGTDGVTMTSGTYTPSGVCDQGLAEKLGIAGVLILPPGKPLPARPGHYRHTRCEAFSWATNPRAKNQPGQRSDHLNAATAARA